MSDVDHALSAAFADLAEAAPHDQDLAGTVLRRVRATRRRSAVVVAVAGVVAAAGVGVAAAQRPTPLHAAGPLVVPAPAPPCNGTPTTGVLPVWARTGFGDPRPVAPYVTSRSGNVVAILFGPWTSTPRGRSTKILWAWRDAPASGSGDPARMSAQLDGTGPVVTAGLPAPYGPSGVELPASGCWRVTLTSSRGTDTLDLDTR